jgi:hypothetical protein
MMGSAGVGDKPDWQAGDYYRADLNADRSAAIFAEPWRLWLYELGDGL